MSDISERVRGILDGLSNLRIHPDEINNASTSPDGIGGKAEVVKATVRGGAHTHDQQVAVKKLNIHDDMNIREFYNEFAHEVKVLAGLSHKNIVQFIGFVEDFENGKAWIILGWKPNGNISEFLATGKWEIPERISLISDTFDGIKYLHTRQPPICHGDLKSLNILVSSSYRAIITDFGSARAVSASEPAVEAADKERRWNAKENPALPDTAPHIHLAASGNQLTLTGPAFSLRWAPPEVVNGERPGLPSDIWAAGWVCWEIMTEKVPFPELNSMGAITLMVVQGNVPSAREDAQLSQIIGLCSLMTDCWAFDPRERPSISECCVEVTWMPSIPPLGGVSSESKENYGQLLLQMGSLQFQQGDYEKAVSLFSQALNAAGDEDEQKASALCWLGKAYRSLSKTIDAQESYRQAQAMYARTGDDLGRADALRGLGHVYRSQSKFPEAAEALNQALDIFARAGKDHRRANTLDGLGQVYLRQRKFPEAEESFIQAQAIFTRNGDGQGRANTLHGLGESYRIQSKITEAEECFVQSRDISTRIGYDRGRANALRGLGRVYHFQCKYTEAKESFIQARDIFTRIGNERSRVSTLEELQWLYPHTMK